MMKIKITKPGAAVTAEFEEAEAEEMFKEITAKMLGINRRDKQEKVGRTVSEKPPEAEAREFAPAQTAAEDVGSLDHNNCDLHSGFLYIKCRNCGAERAYCQKTPSEYSICKKCGSRTYFTDPLKQILTICECGKRSRYLTNMTEEMFDIQCINCGSPVAVKHNQKTKRYETIR